MTSRAQQGNTNDGGGTEEQFTKARPCPALSPPFKSTCQSVGTLHNTKVSRASEWTSPKRKPAPRNDTDQTRPDLRRRWPNLRLAPILFGLRATASSATSSLAPRMWMDYGCPYRGTKYLDQALNTVCCPHPRKPEEGGEENELDSGSSPQWTGSHLRLA